MPHKSARKRRRGIVTIDYRLEEFNPEIGIGPHNACLLGMSHQQLGGDLQYVTKNTEIANTLHAFGDRRRVYANALHARSIELREGLPLADGFDDVSIMARLLDEDWPRDVNELAGMLLVRDATYGKLQTVESTLALCSKVKLRRRIHDEGMEAVYRIERDVVDPTIAMMHSGIRVDTDVLQELTEEFDQRAANSEGKAARKYANICDTAKRLQRFVDPLTGRVHCILDPLGTPTGRFTCTAPPLQALPAELRRAVVADDDYVLLEADFAQVELRVLAHFTQEAAFLEAYSGDGDEGDLHRRTAALALGIDEADVTDKQRNRIGKAVNFAIIYGQTPHGLADKLGIDVEQAQEFIDAYFDGYPRIRNWKKTVERQVARDGVVWTLYGRRRHLPDVWSRNKAIKSKALRQAVNTIIQGTAADINKMALARLHGALPGDCRMLLTVHDSVLIEIPEDQTEAVGRLVKRAMEKQPSGFLVPLAVDVKCGRSWDECI